MRKSISIYQIAREAGVSPSTVSRVMSRNANVSVEKRQKVQSVIEKYDYRPNILAQGLSTTRTRVIGIAAADIQNPYYATIIQMCEKALVERGYTPMTSGSLSRYDLEIDALQKMYDMRMDAIILLGGRSDQLHTDKIFTQLIRRISKSVPVITTGKIDDVAVHRIRIDETEAMRIALEHLFGLGHRNIAMVGGRDDVDSSSEKRSCYRRFMEEKQLPCLTAYIVDSSYNIQGGYEGMQKLWTCTAACRPTAVVAINDFAAVGVMHYLFEQRIKVPDEVAVLSFDNTYIAESTYPRLSSIGYAYEYFGRQLANTAIDLSEGRERPLFQQITPELVVRASTVKLIL